MKRARAPIFKLTSEVVRGNYLYAASSARFQEAMDAQELPACLEDIKLLQMIPKDSEAYTTVMKEYMQAMAKRRERRHAEEN